MPNDLVHPKGPYTLNKRFRPKEERQEEKERHERSRLHKPKPKRTKRRIAQLIAYYFVFYLVLIMFTLAYFALVSKYRVPTHHSGKQKSTSLATSPGSWIRVMKIIRYKENQNIESTPYVEQLNKFIKPFGDDGMKHVRECNLDDSWGYSIGEPCILLKLNFAINFTAKTYEDSITLPKDVPYDLYDHILQLPVYLRVNRIWASCEFMGNYTPAEIEYIPDRSYDADGLFQRSTAYFQSVSENITGPVKIENPAYKRVIGVKFKRLPLNKDIFVQCRVWARNIPAQFSTVVYNIHVEGAEIIEKVDEDYD